MLQAAELTARTTGLLHDIRFSVVVFRDLHARFGEYELLQPFTSDTARVKDALGRVKINPHPGSGGPESYNLAFQRRWPCDRLRSEPVLLNRLS